MTAGLHSLPFVDQIYQLVNKYVDGQIPWYCPVLPGVYNISNITFNPINHAEGFDVLSRTLSSMLPPNGIYRNFFRISFPNDPGGMCSWNKIEHNVRNNDDRF